MPLSWSMSIGARIDITFKDQWLGPIDVFWGWLSFLAELKAVHENGRGVKYEQRTQRLFPWIKYGIAR